MPDTDLISYMRLQHHLKKPDIEEVWLHGYEVALDDQDEALNPYPLGSVEHQRWSDGWWAGFYGEEPLFDLAGNVNSKALEMTQVPAALDLPEVANQAIISRAKVIGWGQSILKLVAALLVSVTFYQLADMVL